MNYSDYVKHSRVCVRADLERLRTDIVAFAAALEFEPQTSLDWNLCIIAHAHGTAPRPSHLPRAYEKELCGVASLVVKCIIARVPQDTQKSKNIKHVCELLDRLDVTFIKHKTNGRAVKKCRWCRERMTPEHRLCKKNNVGSAARVLATYDAGMYKTLKYVTINPPPPRDELPRVCTTRVLPQPIAEEVAEHII